MSHSSSSQKIPLTFSGNKCSDGSASSSSTSSLLNIPDINIGNSSMVIPTDFDNVVRVLPTDIILKIFLLSDGATIARGRCMSRDWYHFLTLEENMCQYYVIKGGDAVVIHLHNPLNDDDHGRLSLYDLQTRSEIPLANPVECQWFSLFGSAQGHPLLLVWKPFSALLNEVVDPRFVGFPLNHRPGFSVYAYVACIQNYDYHFVCLIKSSLLTKGYDMHVYDSRSFHWSDPRHTPLFVDRISDQYVVYDNTIFWCSSRYGLHVATINIGAILLGSHLIGMIHSIRDVDFFNPSYGRPFSLIHFCSISTIEWIRKYAGSMRWQSVVDFKVVYGYRRF
ncbi:hypothetical protein HN51_036715 [Arachis hypogaea]